MSCSFAEIHSSLKKKCQKVDDNDFSSSKVQIDYILDKIWDIQKEFKEKVVPVLEKEKSDAMKSIVKAEKYKKFFESLKNLTEPNFIDDAYEKLNQTIMAIPKEQRNYLLICFAHRSSMHYHRNEYELALKDIDHALQLRLSFSLVERKVVILNKMNRQEEAYKFVENVVKNKKDTLQESKYKMYKKLLKKLKKFKYQKDLDGQIPYPDPIGHNSFDVIKIDSRVEIKKNPSQRYSFIAKEAIGSETEFLSEKPLILTIRSGVLSNYCLNCHLKVVNVFWPCSQCCEVVFCSKTCADQADYHQLECGFTGLMQQKINNQSLQVYRTFANIGLKNLTELEKKKDINFSMEECFKNLNEIQTDDSTLFEWFIMNQADIFKRIEKYKPLRSSLELCNAICLFMIYCYQSNINMEDLNRKQIIQAIDFLANTAVKVQINEYCWNDSDKISGEKIQIGNFQCLFGSSINHMCEPNAAWSFDNGRFTIKTLRDVNKGEELAITYGVSKDQSLYKRQRHLQNFYVMCNCSRCAKEVCRTFAIRCKNCNGPIPYDHNDFVNEICMNCEQKYDCQSTMSAVQNRYQSVRRAICMVGQIDDEVLLKEIESLMSTVASYIYLKYEPFIEMVRKLCDRYFELKLWSSAIEWYQWFEDCVGADLCKNSDELIHYANLDKWTIAYVKFFEEKIQAEQWEDITNNYLITAGELFRKQFNTLESLESNVNLMVMDQFQVKKFVKKSLNQVQTRFSHFKNLLKDITFMCEDEEEEVVQQEEQKQQSEIITGDRGSRNEVDDAESDKISVSSRTLSSELVQM